MNAKHACQMAARWLSHAARNTRYLTRDPIVIADTCGDSGWISLTPTAMTVLRAAARLEHDPTQVMDWYRSTPIAPLDQLSAEALVAAGRARDVLAFLHGIDGDCGS